MKRKGNILFEWDDKPIPHCSEEEQKEFDEYEKNHMDHPEFYSDYEAEDDIDEEHS